MSWLRRILSRGGDIDREIEDELRFHIETKIERYIQAGMSPEEARRKAMERFGNLQQIREAVREIEIGNLESVWQDLRYGARTLARSPAFTAMAVLSLALGIGMNTAVFSAIDAVLLRPLPYPDADRVVHFDEGLDRYRNGREAAGMSPANYLDFEKQNQVFASMAVYERLNSGYSLQIGSDSDLIRVIRVSHEFFQVLGVQPALGRAFLPEEDRPHSMVAVLSHDLWTSRFRADPGILGRYIRLNGDTYRVIGVMPRGFRFYHLFTWPAPVGAIDAWLPYAYENNPVSNRQLYTLSAVARLRNGISIQQARAAMEAVAAGLIRAHPKENEGMHAWVSPLGEDLGGQARTSLLLLFGAVALVLLIACANIANLLLARAATRRHEISLRLAIGATRRRLLRQLLTESCLLAVLGGAAGLVLAQWGTRLLKPALPSATVRLDDATLDWRVAGFALSLSLFTGLLFGLAPAIQGSRLDLITALKSGVRGGSSGRRSRIGRESLVVMQMALSVLLLSGAGLMVNSVWRLHRIRLGFNPAHVLAVRCRLPVASPYAQDLGIRPVMAGSTVMMPFWAPTPEAIRYADGLADRLRSIPGVVAAAGGFSAPLIQTQGGRFRIADRPAQQRRMSETVLAVGPQFFQAMQIPLVQGRGFTRRDDRQSPGVVVVNRSFVRTYFPNRASVLGERLIFQSPSMVNAATPWFEIVGVADDVRAWIKQEYGPQIYVPAGQNWANEYPESGIRNHFAEVFVIRTSSDPASIANAVRKAILDAGRPASFDIRTYDDVVAETFSPWTSTMLLLAFLAGLAVLLALIGAYGVISYTAAQRIHEIGVRMALGAGRRQVMRLLIRRGMALAAAGLLTGAAAACALTRLLASQLYGVAPTDPLTLGCAAALLLGLALLACYVPARRAARLDPISALRCE